MQTPTDMKPEWLSGQAQRVWSMLDDMAATDPTAYRNFIQKQMTEGREQIAPPDSSMCVQTAILKPKKSRLFINFCGWNKVPQPKTPDDAVPVMGGEMQQFKDDDGKCSIMNLAFNPKVLEEFGKTSKNSFDTDALINLAMDYIQDQHSLKLQRTYSIQDFDQKGPTKLILHSFRRRGGDKDVEADLDNLEKHFGHLVTGGGKSTMENIANITADGKSGFPLVGKGSEDKGEELVNLRLPNDQPVPAQPKKKLIQEVKAEGETAEALQEGDAEEKLLEPEHELEFCEEEDGSEVAYLDVFLPGVKSMSQAQLSVSKNDVHLLVPGEYELSLDLETRIDMDKVTAAFCRKTSKLTLTLPVVAEN